MKKKIYIISALFTFVGCVLFGLYSKTTYEDFNKISTPMNLFTVGLLSEETCERQVIKMRNTLSDSNYILAAKVVGPFVFMPSCTTQRIEIIKVFMGEGLSKGDTLDVVCSQEIFWDENSFASNEAWINMGYTNQYTIGKTYLFFLDREIETYNSNRLFIRSDEYMLTPTFPYNNPNIGWTCSENSDPDILDCRYSTVEKYDYFLSSERCALLVKELREEMIGRYAL